MRTDPILGLILDAGIRALNLLENNLKRKCTAITVSDLHLCSSVYIVVLVTSVIGCSVTDDHHY